MFDNVAEMVRRLMLATDPAQDDSDGPTLDPDGGIVADLVRTERAKAVLDARSMLLMSTMCRRAEAWQDIHDPGRHDPVGPDDLAAAEIGPALHLAPVTAAIRVERAERIVTRLPDTFGAYARGDLDLGRVLAIDEATSILTDADCLKVEELVLPGAVDQTAGELRAALRKAVITIDPAAAEKRRKQAVKDREVSRYQDKDGTSVLKAVLSAVDTGEIYDLVDQLARQTKTNGDTRSMDARRADAFVFALLGRDPHLGPEDDDDPPDDGPDQPDHGPDESAPAELGEPSQPDEPDRDPAHDEPDADHDSDDDIAPAPVDQTDPDDPGPVEPVDPEHVPVDLADGVVNHRWRERELNRLDTISELAALMLSAMTSRRAPKLPWVTINPTIGLDGQTVGVGELQAYGPVTADYAEHLLATGAARPAPAPTGRTPTPAQARTHDPPDWLATEIKARDGTCRFMGCRRPAHRVDLDHVIPFPHGLTIGTNLGGLCRRHHRVKGTAWWNVTQHDNGIYEWTSKITGRSYITYPRGATGQWRGTTNHQ